MCHQVYVSWVFEIIYVLNGSVPSSAFAKLSHLRTCHSMYRAVRLRTTVIQFYCLPIRLSSCGTILPLLFNCPSSPMRLASLPLFYRSVLQFPPPFRPVLAVLQSICLSVPTVLPSSPLHQVYSPSTDPASQSCMADFDLSRASHSERFRIQQAPPSDLPRRGLGSYLASAPRLRFLGGWAFSARMYSAFRTPARAWSSDELCKHFEQYLLPVEELRTQASSRC